jgi:tRNA(Ile)-lysidine synthase
VVRPMLAATRREVLAYLTAIGQDYRTDETNAVRRLTRNRIRHELLPLLARDYNPRVRESLGRLADQAAEWSREMDDAIAALLREVERPRAGSVVVLDADELACAAQLYIRGVWRRIWEREGWPRGEMGRDEWGRLAGLTMGLVPALDLPGGIHVRRKERVIQAGPRLAKGGNEE